MLEKIMWDVLIGDFSKVFSDSNKIDVVEE